MYKPELRMAQSNSGVVFCSNVGSSVSPTELQAVFNTGCIKQGFIPLKWRGPKVVFIPKAGNPSNAGPKGSRPIRLSSFLSETLERQATLKSAAHL